MDLNIFNVFQTIAVNVFIAAQITHLQWVRLFSSWLLSRSEMTPELFGRVSALSFCVTNDPKV